jgi:hypothetical protein
MDKIMTAPYQQALPAGKLVHLAISVRWSPAGQEGRAVEAACTYDIHPRGARLLSAGEVRAGDLLLIERGRNKAVCRVTWVADRKSALRGQFAVQCVESGRAPWEDELRQAEEEYHAVSPDAPKNVLVTGKRRGDANRRRRPRFYAEGRANVIDGMQRSEGEIEQLSELGARIAGKQLPQPGTDFRLLLNIFDVSLALKAKVRYLVGDLGMGVEFCEIRRGDRPLLGYVLNQLKTRKIEDVARVEVSDAQLVATAG